MIDYQKPYPSGWEDKPSRMTPITADVLNYYDSTVEAITEEINNIPSTYALITAAGYSLELNIDHETYVMTLQLKNINGTVLDEKTIDFPIESMVVNATYADGIITLILQNGNTTDVDVSSLVSGLVNDTFTIAGIDMKDNITAEELLAALGLDNVKNDISEIKEALQKEEITSVVGETQMTLHDSYAGGIKVNEIDGKSEQFSGTITDESGNEIEVPSPDYPQEIKSVGGSSINMFNIDGEDYIAGYYPNNTGGFSTSSAGNNAYIVKVKPNTTYSISRQVYEGMSTCRINAYSEYPTISSIGSVLVTMDLNTLSYVFTTLADTEYIAFYSNQTGGNQGARLAHIMINEGDIPLPYVPYGVTIALRAHGDNQESVAYLSETLRGIGDVKDRIVRKDGVWQIERNIGEVTFNGSEAWGANSVYPETTRGLPMSNLKANCSLISNKYINRITLGVVDGIYAASSINVTDMRYSTVEEFKASLQDSPLIVLYELATPTYEPLPESEQVAIHSLSSYDTVTYISCDSEVEPTIDVEYGTSRVGGYTLEAWNTAKRNEINNAQLNSAILSLGGNV